MYYVLCKGKDAPGGRETQSGAPSNGSGHACMFVYRNRASAGISYLATDYSLASRCPTPVHSVKTGPLRGEPTTSHGAQLFSSKYTRPSRAVPQLSLSTLIRRASTATVRCIILAPLSVSPSPGRPQHICVARLSHSKPYLALF